jgi:formylmethanofuran--tetrahydromethanopterin N-formyltransferase
VQELTKNGVLVDDTFAEAFGMRATGIVITADTPEWAHQAAITTIGFATSVIASGCEAGIDRALDPEETPDARPGIRVLLFAMSTASLEAQLQMRVGQCVLTCPGTACYAGIESEETIKLGAAIRYFGDGWQSAKKLGGRRFWRVPVMDGEFVCEEKTGLTKNAVGGGNLLIMGRDRISTLGAAEAAVHAIAAIPDVIMPFPGGIVRSGSKVGSRYKALAASTNQAYCPTLKGRVESALTPGVGSVLEIVIDGLTDDAVRAGMRAGLHALCERGAAEGVVRIGAGNYGGKLGKFQYRLGELLR